MNKTELIAKTQENIEIEVTKKDLGIIVEGVLKAIQDEVVAGGKVQLVDYILQSGFNPYKIGRAHV